MATAARLALAAWRNDDVYEVPIRVRGADLSALALAMEVRLTPDTPGAPLVALAKVENGNAQGLRVAGVTTIAGVITSDLRIRINKSTLQGLPYSGEIGNATVLSYALLIAGRTRLFGDFEVLPHAFGSDGAPANRVAGYGRATVGASSGGVTLTISEDGGATITLDGADMLAPLVATATDAAATSQAAAADALATRDSFPNYFKGDKGDPGGIHASIGLFIEADDLEISAGVDRVATTGRSVVGIGAADYISDAFCTPSFAAAHPRATFTSNNHRVFRLLPLDGVLQVEALGATGDSGTGANNDQPAFQAAVKYAEAVVIGIIATSQDRHAIWAPLRTSPNTSINNQYDGLPIVLRRHIEFRSLRGGGTTLRRYGVNGVDPNTAYQIVGGEVWRGGMFFLRGLDAKPADYKLRSGITLRGITVDGGVPIAPKQSFVYPANPGTGLGWDITDKPIWAENDRYTGDIRLFDTTIKRFGGELIYQGGNERHGEIFLRNVIFSESRGDAINPCGDNFDADGVLMENSLQAFEGWGGKRGRLVNCRMVNCPQGNIAIAGGFAANSDLYFTPNRRDVVEMPLFEIDIVAVNCGNFYAGSFLRGRLTLVDTPLFFEAGSVMRGGVIDTALEVHSITDQRDLFSAVVFAGSGTLSESIRNVHVHLTMSRSDDARLAGRMADVAVGSYGSLGPDITIENSSGEARRWPNNANQEVPGWNIRYRSNAFTRVAIDGNFNNGDVVQDVGTAPVVPLGDHVLIYSNTEPIFSLPVVKINDGSEITLFNVGSQPLSCAVGTVIPFTIRQNADVLVRFNGERALWQVVRQAAALEGSAAIDLPSLAAGAISSPHYISVPQARVGMSAQVAPAPDETDLGDDLEITGVRSVTNAVAFKVRNTGAGAVDAISMVFRATAAF